ANDAAASWHEEIERRADKEVRGGPCKAGESPTEGDLHPRGERPGDRTCEPRDQRDSGDRAARILTIDSRDRRKRGFIQAAAHRDAEHEPAAKEPCCVARATEECQAERKDRVRD